MLFKGKKALLWASIHVITGKRPKTVLMAWVLNILHNPDLNLKAFYVWAFKEAKFMGAALKDSNFFSNLAQVVFLLPQISAKNIFLISIDDVRHNTACILQPPLSSDSTF